jgi:hypothetical protein
VALLDARGRRLIDWPLDFRFEATGPQRRVLTGRSPGGRFDLVQGRFPVPFGDDEMRCLALVRHGQRAHDVFGDCLAAPDDGGHLSTREAGGTVRCDLGAAVVVGGAPRAAATARMQFSDGSARRGRVFDSSLGRGFLAVAPSRLGLRRIEIADRTGRVLRTFRTRLPPAARQCGYDFSLSSEPQAGPRPVRAARVVRAAVPPGVSQPYAAFRANRLTALQWQRR